MSERLRKVTVGSLGETLRSPTAVSEYLVVVRRSRLIGRQVSVSLGRCGYTLWLHVKIQFILIVLIPSIIYVFVSEKNTDN